MKRGVVGVATVFATPNGEDAGTKALAARAAQAASVIERVKRAMVVNRQLILCLQSKIYDIVKHRGGIDRKRGSRLCTAKLPSRYSSLSSQADRQADRQQQAGGEVECSKKSNRPTDRRVRLALRLTYRRINATDKNNNRADEERGSPRTERGSLTHSVMMIMAWANCILSSLLLSSSPQHGNDRRCLPKLALSAPSTDLNLFERSMNDLGFSTKIQSKIQQQLEAAGFEDSHELITLANDFVDRSEVFSALLQSDFGFNALMAHRIRAVVMDILLKRAPPPHSISTASVSLPSDDQPKIGTTVIAKVGTPFGQQRKEKSSVVTELQPSEDDGDLPKKPTFKEVVVNDKAKRRKTGANDDYGLPKDCDSAYPLLAQELRDFHGFMTTPSTVSQESPIREATAKVYVRHAKQFLGWFIQNQNNELNPQTISMYDIVPNKEKDSADKILEFILWLRTNRSISVSYEANLLRGLTKMLKFRFAHESQADPSYGEKSFDDIPLIRELRKLHRDANKRQGTSPRSSVEERKWLTWSEYLSVIQSLKSDLLQLIEEYESSVPSPESKKSTQVSPQERKIATVYQYYLVLAFFACVPDRQRTIRELELGRSFVKEQGVWTIKHGPDDYKTGKTYGDRPPLMLSPELVPAIDDFLESWRPCLSPKTEALFVQSRTGNPLTQDSVYQIVARSCFKYSGKKTNPHLLRDMIVTHVRDSDASEKQLEALALYMGHSIQMQRTSYDRRTLKKKVAPAVELLRSVNNMEHSNDEMR